jgi:hypothetical protein
MCYRAPLRPQMTLEFVAQVVPLLGRLSGLKPMENAAKERHLGLSLTGDEPRQSRWLTRSNLLIARREFLFHRDLENNQSIVTSWWLKWGFVPIG